MTAITYRAFRGMKSLNRQEVPGPSHRGAQSCGGAITGPLLPAGLAPEEASDGKAYTSILYGNGPGFAMSNGSRPNVSENQSSECPGGSGGGQGPPRGTHGMGAGSLPRALHLHPEPPLSGQMTATTGSRRRYPCRPRPTAARTWRCSRAARRRT